VLVSFLYQQLWLSLDLSILPDPNPPKEHEARLVPQKVEYLPVFSPLWLAHRALSLSSSNRLDVPDRDGRLILLRLPSSNREGSDTKRGGLPGHVRMVPLGPGDGELVRRGGGGRERRVGIEIAAGLERGDLAGSGVDEDKGVLGGSRLRGDVVLEDRKEVRVVGGVGWMRNEGGEAVDGRF
jgi:hypothetical protein